MSRFGWHISQLQEVNMEAVVGGAGVNDEKGEETERLLPFLKQYVCWHLLRLFRLYKAS